MRPILYHQVTTLTAAKLLCAGLSTLNSAVIAVPGGGHVVGDVITVSGGTFAKAMTFTVVQVDSGGRVTALAVKEGGVATSKPTNPVSTTSSGVGTGLKLTLTWNDNAPPPGARGAIIQAEAQNVRWRDDGTDPTAAVGMILASGASITYEGVLSAIKVIEATATAKINVTFFR